MRRNMTMTTPSRRIPFEHRFRLQDPTPESFLIYQDGVTNQSTDVRYGLREAQYAFNALQREYTSRKDIKRCGQAGHKCKSLYCSACSQSRVSQQRRDLREALRLARHGTLLLWTATIRKRPSASYEDARKDLLRVVQKTVAGGWLKRRGIIGTARVIECEESDGWHVHAHIVLVFRNTLTRQESVGFAVCLRDRYLAKAEQLEIAAGKKAQKIHLGSEERTIRYVTKDVTRLGGFNTASKLWERVEGGDADALALIHEMETGTFRKRQWTVTGVCKLEQPQDFDDLLAKWGWNKP